MTIVIDELLTTGLTLHDPGNPSVWSWVNDHLIDWLGEVCDPQLGTITNPGSGYVDGVYPNVELRRTASTQTGRNHLLCEVTITGGGVSGVTVTQKGNGFKTGDELTIPNVAQVGGAGSGFTIDVASADHTLGFIYDVDRAGTSYQKGFLIGAERGLTYNRGAWINKTSNSSTTYAYDFYSYAPSTSSNSYGSIDVNHNSSMSTWTSSTGDGYTVRIAYSSNTDDRWFIYTDSAFNQCWVIAEMNQPAGGDYPQATLSSRWGIGTGSSSFTFRPFSSVYYTTPHFGTNTWAPPRPSDTSALFTGGAIYGRGYLAGVLPPGIGYSPNFSTWSGRQLQQSTETWDAFAGCIYVRTTL